MMGFARRGACESWAPRLPAGFGLAIARFAGVGALLAAGCIDFGGAPAPAPDRPDRPEFGTHVQPILTQNCALSGCHAGTAPAEGMSLESGKAYANIVDVRSTGYPIYWRVKPGDPDSSLVYLKTALDSPPSGARMPLERDNLTTSEIETIRAWIAAGARR